MIDICPLHKLTAQLPVLGVKNQEKLQCPSNSSE